MSLAIVQTLTYENCNRAYYITMFAMWGIGVDLSRLLIRYGKSFSQVIHIHSISMLIISLLTIIYVFARTITYYTQATIISRNGVQMTQFVFSWILVLFIITQIVLGILTRSQMNNPAISKNLFTIKAFHKFLGFGMSIIGKIMIVLYLQPMSDTLFKAWLFILFGIILVWIAMEVIYRSQTRSIIWKFPHKHKNKHQKYHQQIYQNILKGIEDFQNYAHLGVRYLIIDNVMYYIDQNFIHPGGQFIFSVYNGKEINYLFKGTKQVASNYPRHIHTKFVAKYLQNRVIGDLPTDPILINQKVNNECIQWKIFNVLKEGIQGNLVTFQTDAGYVRQLLKVQNFGKYVMMGCPNQQILNKIERPYSLILSQCQGPKRLLQKFKQAYNYYYTGKSSNTALLQKTQLSQVITNRLTFFIKQYKTGLFTKFLFHSSIGKSYSLTGPYGLGLNLKPNSRGYYIFIGVGTGITPYIDLFTYLLQKTFLDLITYKAGQKSGKKVNNEDLDFNQLNELKILFIGSFSSSKHFYFHSLIKDLYQLNQIHKLNKFNMMLRYQNNEIESNVTMIKDSFDKSFFKSLVTDQKPDKIYYCGPSNIEYTMRKVQQEMGLRDKFFYV